jgi:NADH-quinone oxidoreductase subunit H
MLLAIDLPLIIEKLVLIVVVVMASLVIAMYATFAERKVAAILARAQPCRPFWNLTTGCRWVKIIFQRRDHPKFFV